MDRLALSSPNWLLLLALLSVPVGCADGPVPHLLSLNPKMRQQWEADENYQPTLHRQLAEVETLCAGASGLSAAQQRHWCGEMKHILQTHDSPLLRTAAVDALAEFAVQESEPGLRLALGDTDATVRRAACRAWGKRGGHEAMQLLCETLGSDADPDVRIVAADQLSRFSDPMAYQALGLALQDRDAALQHRAVQSLTMASGKNFGNDLKAWQAFAQGQDPGPEYAPSVAERVRELF